jgi:hypothetical protein
LIIPPSEDLSAPDFDVSFKIDMVDDGLQMISNGFITANYTYGQSFTTSLHKGQDGNLSALKNGANTIAAIWLDDCASYRTIDNDVILYKGKTIATVLPNVIRGYTYDKHLGTPIANVKIMMTDSKGAVVNLESDAQGFFQAQGIADGNAQLIFDNNGVQTTRILNLDHLTATTSVVEASTGL